MANADRPSGLTPVRMLNGDARIPVNVYSIAATYGTALYIGDGAGHGSGCLRFAHDGSST